MAAEPAIKLDKARGDDVAFDLDQFPRLKRLRHELLYAGEAICIERARLVTEYFMEHGFRDSRPVLRQAEVLRHVLERLTPTLFDDELIVGSTTRHRVGMVTYPEFLSLTIWPELPTMASRAEDPIRISDGDADYLANVVFPFWKDLTIIEHVRRENNDPESLRLMERVVFYALTKANGMTHLVPDYETLVRRGIEVQIKEARKRERKAKNDESREFHQAVRICFEGVLTLAARYADACDDAALGAAPERAEELKHIAAVLRKVPAEPASTLQEALQSMWITQVALHQENSNMALSFGRLDQVLYPLYEADLAAGRIDAKRAAELIGCFYMKIGDHLPLAPKAGQEVIGKVSTDQAVTVGGVKPDGTDGVNDLTYLMLKLSAMLALMEPNLCARIHGGSSPEYIRALVESIYRNGAAPALYNDDRIVEALASHGLKLEHARDYGVVGCVETTTCYRSMCFTGAIMFNLAAVLELTLNDGVFPASGLRIGPSTGRFSDFKSFDEFQDAFVKQLDNMVDLAHEGNTQFGEAHSELHPVPLLSGMLRGTAESGRDATRGGAMYNSSGIAIIGFADVADSLTAIRELVFNEGRISPAELSAALADDFEGHEKIRALLMNKAPKYGTDDPKADDTAAQVIDMLHATFGRHKNPRGGRYHLGLWSATMHTGLGKILGALPNGRRKGTPMASGATPVSGVARKGPTAAFTSTSRLPVEKLATCLANNHKLSRSLLGEPGKLDVFQKLVEGYFKQGGMQTQFTVQDRETLIAARDNPEQYRDLLVRVSGYTAYFCDLNLAMQNEIIGRTEDSL